MQVEEQVSDDELSLISWDEFHRARSEDGLHETPPALQSMALGTQAASHSVPLHHLLQDGVHLLSQTERALYLKLHTMYITYYYTPTKKHCSTQYVNKPKTLRSVLILNIQLIDLKLFLYL